MWFKGTHARKCQSVVALKLWVTQEVSPLLCLQFPHRQNAQGGLLELDHSKALPLFVFSALRREALPSRQRLLPVR